MEIYDENLNIFGRNLLLNCSLNRIIKFKVLKLKGDNLETNFSENEESDEELESETQEANEKM